MAKTRKLFGWMYGSGVGMGLLLGCILAIPLYFGCEALNFPTVKDVNTMADADHEFVAAEHAAIVDAMTEQHAIQDPAAREAIEAITAQYNALAAQLRAKAAETTAKGVSLGGLGIGDGGLWSWLVTLMGGGGILGWVTNLFKPSRATGRIDDLEKKLMVAAPAGDAFPGETSSV